MNRLAGETSPYLLQHAGNPVATASLAMPSWRSRRLCRCDRLGV